MAFRNWPFSKPVGLPVGLTLQELNDQYVRLDFKWVASHKGHRFGFRLNQPVDLLVKITSTLATQKGWYRAGYLANIITGAPISEPVQDVERIYFGQQHLSIPYTGLDHYFEFWPHLWIADYRIELWAKQALSAGVVIPEPEPATGLLLFNTGEGLPTEEFTFFGALINFP